MPFRHLKPGRFDLDTLKLMQQAFDTVCAKLEIDEGNSRRLTLANEIIRLAAEGTREQLAEQAEGALALAAPPPSKPGHWTKTKIKIGVEDKPRRKPG